jgi:anti-sigma-K factor RskA
LSSVLVEYNTKEGSLIQQAPREKSRALNRTAKEKTMNTFVSALYRDLTCAAAAVLISVVVGMSFVQSTATAPAVQTVTASAQQSS